MASIKRRQTSRGDRWDARLRVNGRQVSKTFARRRDAEQWVKLVEADRVLGVAIDPGAGRVRFGDYASDWIDGRRLAPRTVQLYRDLLRRLIVPTFGDAQVAKITPESVRRWHKALSDEKGQMQAAKSYRLMRAVLNTATADGLIARNPCRIPGAGQERSAERPFVTADLVLDLADAIAPRYRALVLLAGFGGLRRGELLGLRRHHVDLEAGTVTVEEQVVILTGEGRRTTAPKTDAGRRTVHLPTAVVDVLADHLDLYAEPGPDGHVFTGDKGGPLSIASLYPAFSKARERAGLDGVRLHDLRHAAGTMAAWNGATTRELMARLGHSSPRAALIYQHAAETRDREIASHLDDVIAAARRPKAPVVDLMCDGRAMEGSEHKPPADADDARNTA